MNIIGITEINAPTLDFIRNEIKETRVIGLRVELFSGEIWVIGVRVELFPGKSVRLVPELLYA